MLQSKLGHKSLLDFSIGGDPGPNLGPKRLQGIVDWIQFVVHEITSVPKVAHEARHALATNGT